MKIGLYVAELAPEVGGSHTFTMEIVAEVARRARAGNCSVSVWLEGPDPPAIDLSGIEVVRSQESKHVARASRALTSLGKVVAPMMGLPTPSDAWARRLRAAGVDLLWSPSQGVPTFELPFVMSIWDLQHRLQPWFPEVSIDGEWDRRERYFSAAIPRAAGIICGTDTGAREVERFYGVPPGRCRTVPQPTPSFTSTWADVDGAEVVKRLGLTEPYLLYPAQLWPHKNHAVLIEALRLLRARGDHVQLALVGSDKGMGKHLRALSDAARVSEHVRALGFVPQRDLAGLYRRAAVLAYPSYFGPDNLPPLEAFALGCPVVAAAVDGSQEQLGDAASLVDPRDPVAWAEAIHAVLHDGDLRSTLVARGRERAKRSTPSTFVNGALALINELAPVVSTWGSR